MLACPFGDCRDKRKAFTVSMGDKAHMLACDYVGIVSGNKEPDKMEKAGFTTTKSEFVDAPVINELPVALECELIKVLEGSMYLAKIVNVAADESVLSDEGKITLSKFSPITYDTSEYGYQQTVIGKHRTIGIIFEGLYAAIC